MLTSVLHYYCILMLINFILSTVLNPAMGKEFLRIHAEFVCSLIF